MIRKALISTPILLLVAGAAAADETGKKNEVDIRAGVKAEAEAGETMPAPPAGAADIAVGTEAVSADGKTVGTVVEIVSDSSGDIRSLIVETDGLLMGIGAREVAVPADKVSVSVKSTVVTMTKAEFEKLPDHKG